MEFQGYDKNFGLTGKVAFITGGAAGIGKAIATLFKEKNARLALADLNPAVREVASDLSADQATVLPLTCDITKAEERNQAVDVALKQFGRIDILVNNAGLAILEPALEVSENSWDRTLDLNLKAAFFLAQRIGKEMVNQRRGKIINIGSQAGMIALDRHLGYIAGKAAVIGVSKVLGFGGGAPGVRVKGLS